MEFQDLSIAFYESFLAIVVFLLELQTRRSAFFTKLRKIFEIRFFFDPQDIDLEAPKLYMIEI